ncbi:MAG: hypothetical protein HY690_00005 [Chloroflexi bacterium]|nr:hypothetical protein [Chloroflexota bacterium]
MIRSQTFRSGVARALALAGLLGVGLAPGALAQESPDGEALSIAFPTDGAVLQSTDIPVRVQVGGFNLACDEAGAPDRSGAGHLHVMLDGMSMAQLTNFYCTQEFWISGQGVQAGQHTLTLDLATNTHADLMDTAKSVTFLYQPTKPAAALPQSGSAKGATVEISAPKNGATVGPQFKLEVKPTDFTASCDLEGKQNVAGFGHYHVFVDMDPGAMMMGGGAPGAMDMMSMAGMISMPCGSSIPVDLTAWPSGQHMLSVELEQNDHTPLMEPGQGPKFATITVNLQNPFQP